MRTLRPTIEDSMRIKKPRQALRVGLVDDHLAVAQGFEAIFRAYSDLHIVSVHTDAQTLLAQVVLDPTAYDVILTDLRMPVMSGITLCHAIKTLPTPPRVVLLTQFGDTANLLEAREAGADGYILKISSVDEIHACILQAYASQFDWTAAIEQSIADTPTLARGVASHDTSSAHPYNLTSRERLVLKMVACDTLTTSQIALKLGRSVDTVETHRKAIMLKMGAKNSTELVWMALELGICSERISRYIT